MPRSTKYVRSHVLGVLRFRTRTGFDRLRVREVIVFGVLASALVATIAVTWPPAPTYPVYDGSGVRLESLFAGLAPDAEARESFLWEGASARRASDPCRQAPAIVRQLASWIDPPSASAYSCGTGCGGHYMYYVSRRCSTGCNSGWHSFYYSDPNQSMWQLGWKQPGGTTCGECGLCAEITCINWY